MSQTRMDELSRIVQALAALPGSSAMNVVSRTFPRFGPAETGTPYREETRSFTADSIPEGLNVSADVEEIIITLEGTLPEAQAKDDLVERLNDLLGAPDMAGDWDLRARFTHAQSAQQAYELTVFRNPGAGRNDAYA